MNHRGVEEPGMIFAVMDAALAAANRAGEWRNWTFLTRQVQLAAERVPSGVQRQETHSLTAVPIVRDNPLCEWAIAKTKIRNQIGEIPFLNWFDSTRQVVRQGAEITIAVSDELSRIYLETEYGTVTRAVLAEFGIREMYLTVADQGKPLEEKL